MNGRIVFIEGLVVRRVLWWGVEWSGGLAGRYSIVWKGKEGEGRFLKGGLGRIKREGGRGVGK
jgi:hypothetical protein